MKLPVFTLPPAAAMLVRPLPRWPASGLLALMLNAGIGRIVTTEDIAPLDDRRVRLTVTDLGFDVTVECRGGRFQPSFAAGAPDVTVAATLRDFAALAVRADDPDTLFFARRLRITGDTELGLTIKNLLDGIDLGALVPWATARDSRG